MGIDIGQWRQAIGLMTGGRQKPVQQQQAPQQEPPQAKPPEPPAPPKDGYRDAGMISLCLKPHFHQADVRFSGPMTDLISGSIKLYSAQSVRFH